MSTKPRDTKPSGSNIAVNQSDDHGTTQQNPDEHASTKLLTEGSEAQVSECQDATVTDQNEGANPPSRPSFSHPVTVQAVPTVIICPKEPKQRPQPQSSSLASETSQLEGSSSHVRPRKSVVIMDYPQQPGYPQQYYGQPMQGQPMMVQQQPMMVQQQPMMMQQQPMMVQQQPYMVQQQPIMVQQQPYMVEEQRQESTGGGGCCASCFKLLCSLCLSCACAAALSPCIAENAGEGISSLGEGGLDCCTGLCGGGD